MFERARLSGAANCQSLKHVTLQNVVINDILIDNKLEVLKIYNCLRQSREIQLRHKHHFLQIAY